MWHKLIFRYDSEFDPKTLETSVILRVASFPFFQNSPLYQYLQDLGHTDFEICSSLPPKTENCLPTEGPHKPPARVLPKVRKHAPLFCLHLLFFTLMIKIPSKARDVAQW